MNAVATPARKVSTKAAPKRQRTAMQRIETGPAWEQLAKAVSLDLADAAAQITALADSVGSGADPLPSIGTLLDEARHHLDKIQSSLVARPLLQQITDDAYTALFKPLALVEGAAALTAGIDVDVISPALHAVHEKLDEAQSNLSDQVLGKMLPTLPETEFSTTAVKHAFTTVRDLLHAASVTDEPRQWSGDSDRLLRMASSLAGDYSDRPPMPVDIAAVAFDVAALVRGSRLMPGESESPERTTLIDEAAKLLDWLAETTNCCDPGADRPQLRSAQPAAQAVHADSQDDAYRELARSSTLEIEQLAETLQQVTNHSDNEDRPLIHGIMARTIVLSKIIFLAAALHGDDRAYWGSSLEELQRSFKGAV